MTKPLRSPDRDRVPGRVAGDHATRAVPIVGPGATVGEARELLAERSYSFAHWVAVLDGDRLAGVAPIEALLTSEPQTPVAELMDRDPPTVGPGVPDELAAALMVESGSCLAVAGPHGDFQGLVPAKPMLAVLVAEHEEDLARIGGFTADTRKVRQATEEPVSQRLLHRLPWLLLGLLGAMASAVLIGAFEQELDEKVLLALFVPAIVYLADAVGTQTEALLIRGLSVRLRLRQVIRRELITGLIMGVVMGLAFMPFAYLGWGDRDVAIAVGLALFCACSIATLVAMGLPLAFVRLGIDPAYGSGPLATVIQDLLSIAVYLAIAIPFAG